MHGHISLGADFHESSVMWRMDIRISIYDMVERCSQATWLQKEKYHQHY